MTCEIKKLDEVVEMVQGAFLANVPNSDPLIQPNNLWVASTSIAGILWESIQHTNYLAGQSFIANAEGQYLRLHAQEQNLYSLPATPAIGNVRFIGVDGTAVPTGTIVTRTDGVQYEVVQGGFISGTEFIAEVRCLEFGVNTNTSSGSKLQLSSVLADIGDFVTVQGGLINGTNAECDEDLRARLLANKRNCAFSGTQSQWEERILNENGFSDVWIDFKRCGCECDAGVYFLVNGESPEQASIDQLQLYLDQFIGQCFNAKKAQNVDISISIQCTSTPEQRLQINSAIEALLNGIAHGASFISRQSIQDIVNLYDPNGVVTMNNINLQIDQVINDIAITYV